MTTKPISENLTLFLAREMIAKVDGSDSSRDDFILAFARHSALEILTDADIRLNELHDQGWKAPEDVVEYAARLLFLADTKCLDTAVRHARAVYAERGVWPWEVSA